jgi:WD40 repeat protein
VPVLVVTSESPFPIESEMLIYSIKKWKCPEGIFVNNFTGHEAIINTLSLNSEGVLFSGADNGTLTMWDYKTGLPFQHLKDIPQPGSLDAEAVSELPYDVTGANE